MTKRIRSLFVASGEDFVDSIGLMSPGTFTSNMSPVEWQPQRTQQPPFRFWFSPTTLEDLFVMSLMQDTVVRVIATASLAAAVLASMFQALDPTTYVLFAVNAAVWFLASAALALLILNERPRNQLSSGLRSSSWSSSSALSVVAQARITEAITVFGLFGGNVVYTMANVVSGLTCHSAGFAPCLDGDGYETNGMFTFLILCIVAPARTVYVVVCALVHIAATIGTFLWRSKEPTPLLYQATLLLTSQLAACVVIVHFREVQSRKTFLLRRQQEDAVRRMEAVRRLAVETAAQRMPEVVVCSLSSTGAYSSRGDAIVVAFGLANFGYWSSFRGPRDVVGAVMGLVEACEAGMAPLFANASLIALPLTKLGDNVTFVFLPHGGAATMDACVSLIFSTTLVAMHTVEMICREVLDQLDTATVSFISSLGPPEMNARHLQRKEHVRLHPMCAVTGGDVHVWFASGLCNLMASGAPIDEATRALLVLSNTHQGEPRLHLATCVASRCDLIAEQLSAAQTAIRGSEIRRINSDVNNTSVTTDESNVFASTLENTFQLEGLILQRFADSATERAFEEDRTTNSMDLHIVLFHAVSMFIMGVAMLGVCLLYVQLSWSVRSPLPYVVGCCVVAVVLFVYCSLHSHRQVFVLDACYWLFCFSCLAASIMPPQDSSVFSQSIFPWCLIAGTVSFQRPLWYGPLTMWSLELCISLTVLLWVFFPIRDVSPFVASVALRMTVPAGVVGLVLRLLMDRQARSHFKWHSMLPKVHGELVRETNNLIRFLDGFMPSRVAERILAHRFSKGRLNGSAAVSLMRPNKMIGGLNANEPLKLMTSVEDQAFGIIQLRSRGVAAAGGVVLPGGAASRLSSIAPSKSLVDVVADALREFHESSSATTNAFRVSVVKVDGDIVMLASDAAVDGGGVNASESLGSGCKAMAKAVRRLHAALEEKGMEVRSVVGACPMIGAVIGGLHAPSFEWFASEVHSALRMLRTSDDSGPICWGRVVCTVRAEYHMTMTAADTASRACFIDIKIAGTPRQRVSILV